MAGVNYFFRWRLSYLPGSSNCRRSALGRQVCGVLQLLSQAFRAVEFCEVSIECT
jgi:hypothetical protein